MKEQNSSLNSETRARINKRSYAPPQLSKFGSVTELTNSASGDCMDDADNNACLVVGNMSMTGN